VKIKDSLIWKKRMREETDMGREDVYENNYLEDPEIFADLVNGVLYEGKQQSNADERINTERRQEKCRKYR
jgi:hypothetical protein